ncbi:MAG: LptF/LptG family permease [bacterium]
MRILSRYILKEHVGPFFLSLAVLTFLFLMQYLIDILDMVIGKGLEVTVVVELFLLNIAWMLALTVPMAVLVSVLMAFGRMSHDGEITALKASGVGVIRLGLPVFFAGMAIAAGLVYFNDRILPESNYLAKTLQQDIRAKRPGLAIRSGVFMEDVPGYTLRVDSADPMTGRVEGVTVVQYLNFDPPDPPRVIRAAWGVMQFDEEGESILLDLRDGTITEVESGQTRLQEFQKFKTSLAMENTRLERSRSGVRGDRELSIAAMEVRVAERDSMASLHMEQLRDLPEPYIARVVRGEPVDLTESREGLVKESRIIAAHKSLQADLESAARNRSFYSRQASRYRVEIHKKYAIPFACIAFVLIGIPLGIMARRGGAIIGFGVALAFFLLYWSCLILGEDLADRDLMDPWLAMWLPNLLVTGAGITLIVRGVYEQTFIRWESLARRLPGRLGRRLAERLSEGEAGP